MCFRTLSVAETAHHHANGCRTIALLTAFGSPHHSRQNGSASEIRSTPRRLGADERLLEVAAMLSCPFPPTRPSAAATVRVLVLYRQLSDSASFFPRMAVWINVDLSATDNDPAGWHALFLVAFLPIQNPVRLVLAFVVVPPLVGVSCGNGQDCQRDDRYAVQRCFDACDLARAAMICCRQLVHVRVPASVFDLFDAAAHSSFFCIAHFVVFGFRIRRIMC